MALKLRHIGYSQEMVGHKTDEYLNRPRITSLSKTINGGVYCPPGLETSMEAIVVDYEKDSGLRSYLEQMDKYVASVVNNLQKVGRKMGFINMVKTICHKITADFPYSDRMLDKAYMLKKYPPGRKVHLGVLMANQDMICRHMGLLMGAVIDYCKENFTKNKNLIKFKPDSEIGFMADTQKDLEENARTGHAYLIVRKPKPAGKGNDVFVVDPSAGHVVEIGQMIMSKSPKGPGFYRYMFSAVRFLLQTKNQEDNDLLDVIFVAARYDATLLQVLKDVNKSLRTPEAITNYVALIARLNMKGL